MDGPDLDLPGAGGLCDRQRRGEERAQTREHRPHGETLRTSGRSMLGVTAQGRRDLSWAVFMMRT
uniref:Uncharacterized protein n=1 Tax=Aurantimonas coralicida TaxID=182270 RepID=A0A0P0YYA6_9HYPH|nr:hypothetical protein [Aurantimonas coralicida]